METRFINLCKKGDLIWLQQLLQLNPDINISAINDEAFRYTCANGHLHVAQWLLQVSKKRGQDIDISAENEFAFRWAYNEGHYHIVKWLQSLKPDAYKLEYDKNGKYKGYKIRSKEEIKKEAKWQQRKYLVWLASEHCPEQNKGNLLYKLPSDVSRMIIGFV